MANKLLNTGQVFYLNLAIHEEEVMNNKKEIILLIFYYQSK